MPRCAMRKSVLVLGLAVISMSACAVPASVESDVLYFSYPSPAQAPILLSTIEPAYAQEYSPTPVPSPTPETSYAKIGAVGDIMIMQSQVSGAWNKETKEYDFTPSFRGMRQWFSDADILLANLETPLAGEEAGYSIAGAEGLAPLTGFQTFNAPDALASSLYACGFNAITTANNHCLDRGADGLFRTAGVLREAGITQLGSYLSEDDRNTGRVIEANGISVGLLSWTVSVNKNDGLLSGQENKYAIARTADKARMQEDIRIVKEAGAEFIIAYMHWDVEFMTEPRDSTRKLAVWLLEQGVGAVIGAHPHVLQPMEYVTVTRGEEKYTGLIAYSLGNFISNMSPSPRDYGVYLELTLEKPPLGEVTLYEAGILPLYCIKRKVDGRMLHEVIPALEDITPLVQSGEFSSDIIAKLSEAREYVLLACGDEVESLE